jgi:hypothetical protein
MSNKIREAYEQARREGAANAAPAWEKLPLALREAITGVFYAGRIDALREKDTRL